MDDFVLAPQARVRHNSCANEPYDNASASSAIPSLQPATFYERTPLAMDGLRDDDAASEITPSCKNHKTNDAKTYKSLVVLLRDANEEYSHYKTTTTR